jgi:integrase
VKVHDLYEEVERDYRRSGRESLDKIEERWRLHLRSFFEIVAVTHLTTPVILPYIDARQAEGASINRETRDPETGLQYGVAATSAQGTVRAPHSQPKENNVRTGFLEVAQPDALASACGKVGGPWMQAIFEVGYTFGWRRREVTRLRVKQVQVTSSTMGYIRLDVGTTKNEEGREVPIQGRLLVLLRECIRGKRPDDCVFTREGGEPVRDFRKKTWGNACCAVDLGSLFIPSASRQLKAIAVRTAAN